MQTFNPKTLSKVRICWRLPILIFLLLSPSSANPPENALKYHSALLKSPNNPTLYSRLHNAWLDEQSLESLTAFLKEQAKSGKSGDLAILAQHLLHRGLDDEALIALNSAVKSLPDEPNLLFHRAKILLRKLDFDNARKDLEIVANSEDKTLSIEAAKLVGKSYLRQANPASATATWDKLLTRFPNNEEILEDLVELTASANQLEQAISYSKLLIKSSQDPFKKTQHKIRLAQILSASGQSDLALSSWTETLTDTGEGSWLEAEIIAHISSHFRRQDRIDALLTKLSDLASTHPRRILIHRELAKLEASQGQIDSAIGRFREVLKRSPGNNELRDEFIRLLVDSLRFDDASEEISKIITLTPENPELHIRLADLAHRRAEANEEPADPAKILPSLNTALSLLPPGEASSLRIANLMLSYRLNNQAEELLTKLSADPNATTLPAEALAAEFVRTDRKDKAIEILTSLTKTSNAETLLRIHATITSISPPETALEILSKRLPDFSKHPPYLAAYCQASLAAKKSKDSVTQALQLVKLASSSAEILDATRIATSIFSASETIDSQITTLSENQTRSIPETCLLAALLESQTKNQEIDTLFQQASDTALLRFYSSILARRNDFNKAISTLQQFAISNNTSNKPDYLKELAELQLRANLTQEALKTLDLWQTVAPTAKEPWVIQSRYYRDSGNLTSAIDTTRRALTRFPGDEDLSSSLAELSLLSQDFTEAERILWTLYDNAQDSSAQSRYAARLSSLAQTKGSTEELTEKFLQRARSNSQSISPILALVEIARTNRDENSVREHLARALFIKPSDIDIRIQLANSEAQLGNYEAKLAILSQGLNNDPNGRLRTSIANTHIENGDMIKGLRMLRSLSGDRTSDPRTIETTAISLLHKGHTPEAIQYIQESLPDGGDWRTKFILSLLLKADGRENEAVPILISLLSEESEITNLPANPNGLHNIHNINLGQSAGNTQQNLSQEEKDVNYIRELTTAATYVNLFNDYRYSNYLHQMLPTTSFDLRAKALIQLAAIASSGNEAATKMILTANIPLIPFASDLLKHSQDYGNQNPNYIALFKKHPDFPGLLTFICTNGRFSESPKESIPLLKQIIASKKPSQEILINLLFQLVHLEPEDPNNWQQLVNLCQNTLTSENYPNKPYLTNQLLSLLTIIQPPNLTEDVTKRIKTILLDYANKSPQSLAINHHLSILSYSDSLDPWIAAVNASITSHRSKAPDNNNQLNIQLKNFYGFPMQYAWGNMHSWGAMSAHFGFIDSTIANISFSSLPWGLTSSIARETDKKHNRINQKFVTSKQLLPNIERFDSPLIRAYIAVHSEDETAIAKYLNAPHPEVEDIDFLNLRAAHLKSCGKKIEAAKIYASLFTASSKPQEASPHSQNLIALAIELTLDERKTIEKELRAALTSTIALYTSPHTDYSFIIEQAQILGFDDIVKSLSAPTPSRRPTPSFSRVLAAPVSISPPSSSSRPKNRPSTPYDRFVLFAQNKKNTAAANEFIRWVVEAKKNGNDMSSIAENAKNYLTPEIKKEIFSISNPNNNPSLSKHIDFIRLCQALGENEKAFTALSNLAALRPFDHSITCELAFLLPPSESDRSVTILVNAANTQALANAMDAEYRRLSRSKDHNSILTFYERIARFLEKTSDDSKIQPNFFQNLNNQFSYFFNSTIFSNTKSLLEKPTDNDSRQTPDQNHIAIARRLANAMLRHQQSANYGFLVLTKAIWQEKQEDLDQIALSIISSSLKHTKDKQVGSHLGRHYSSESTQGSATNYLVSRLSDKAPIKLTSEYLHSIEDISPSIYSLFVFLSTPPSTKSIQTLWDSGAMQIHADPNSGILQQAAIKRISITPDSGKFFLSLVKKISSLENEQPFIEYDPFEAHPYDYQNKNQLLLRYAVEASPTLNSEELSELCSAIIKLRKSYNSPNLQHYQPDALIHQIFHNLSIDIKTASRIARYFSAQSITLPEDFIHRHASTAFSTSKTPQELLAILSSMELLADTSTWKPLIICATEYNLTNRIQTPVTNRINQLEYLIRYLNSEHRKKLVELLENYKPATFGSLITAASIAPNVTDRHRLATAAFQQANKYFSSCSEERLTDFELFIHLLPSSPPDSLNPKIQELIKRKKQEEVIKSIAEVRKYIQISNTNSGSPFETGNVSELIAKISEIDINKAVELFIEASQSNNPSSRESNLTDHLIQILQTNSDKKAIETKIRFYQAILNSPVAGKIDIIGRSTNQSPLSTIGYALATHQRPDKNEFTIRKNAWLAASAMQEDIRTIALSSLACHFSEYAYQTTYDDAVRLFGDLSNPLAKDIAIASSTLHMIKDSDENVSALLAEKIINILNNPQLPEVARIQIALNSMSNNIRILEEPKIAEALATKFISYCSQQSSAVNNRTIQIISNISKLNIRPASLPHLKHINESFWKNANSPIPGGHMTIDQNHTLPLFKTALLVGDTETSKRLFSILKPSLKGDLSMIIFMISGGHLDLVPQLLPEDSSPFSSTSSSQYYTPKFHQNILKLRNSNIPSNQLLRLEAIFLKWPTNGMTEAFPNFISERKNYLISSYSKKPPTSPGANIEILSALATSINPSETHLSAELAACASTLDPDRILNDYCRERYNRTDEFHFFTQWPILCKHAALAFQNGDPSPSLKIITAIKKISPTNPNGRDNNNSVLIHNTFLDYFIPATYHAVATNQTKAFSALIHPLCEITSILGSKPKLYHNQIHTHLALTEFISLWENQYETFFNTYSKLQGLPENTRNMFASPPNTQPFLDSLNNMYQLRVENNNIALSNKDFLVALLSHPTFPKRLFFRNKDPLKHFDHNALNEEIAKLAENPPNTLSKAGIAILSYHAYKISPNADNKEEHQLNLLRQAIANTPQDESWNDFRTNAQIEFVSHALRYKINTPEAKKVFDSILPEHVPLNYKEVYKDMPNRFENLPQE